jgi:hypothetical protein
MRVSRMGAARAVRVFVHVVAGIDDKDQEWLLQEDLQEDDPEAVVAGRFIPRIAGEHVLHSIRVAVQDLEAPARTTFLKMGRGAFSFRVAPAESSEPSNIVIQGSVYGSLVGGKAPGLGSTPSYASDPVNWVPVQLAADREAHWWTSRTSEVEHATGCLLLRWTARGQGRMLFITSGKQVRMGRRKEDNDLVLRWLPCRSEAMDPENWKRNQSLSRRHILLNVAPRQAAVEVDPSALAPTYVEVDDHLSKLRPGQPVPLTKEGRFRLGEPDGSPDNGLLVSFQPILKNGRLGGVHVTRPENLPCQAYLVVVPGASLELDSLAQDDLPPGLTVEARGDTPPDCAISLRSPLLSGPRPASLSASEARPEDFTEVPA